MSFKTELESLIASANASLEQLESIVGRAEARSAQANAEGLSKGDAKELRTQVDTVRETLLNSLLDIRETHKEDQLRLSSLEEDLRSDLKNVEQCAIDYFVRGQYGASAGLMSFLCKLQPHDEKLARFLALSRKRELEEKAKNHEPGHLSLKEDGWNKEEPNAPHQQELKHPPVGDDRNDPVRNLSEPTPPGNNAPEVEAQPARSLAAQSAFSVPATGKPQNLADIELKTAARIDETYRTLSEPEATRPRRWPAIVGSVFLLTVVLWFAWRWAEVAVSQNRDTQVAENASASEGELTRLREHARSLFAVGKFQEAEKACDDILAKKPQDSFAIELRDYIHSNTAELKSENEELSPPPPTTESTQASQPSAPHSDKVQVAKRPVQDSPQPSPALEQKRTSAASDNSVARGEAKETLPVLKPETVMPPPVAAAVSAPPQVTAPPEIKPEVMDEISRKIQSKDFDQAGLLLQKLQNQHPGNNQLKTLGERLSAERAKYQSLAASWIEKAEAAENAGRYVAPPDDNAVVYCNLALKAEPGNKKATALKKGLVNKAVTQAKDWISQGKYDAARLFYASMDYLAQKDDSFPLSKAELKQTLQKLEFRTYSVTHEHKMSGCSGKLRFNGYVVSYLPSGRSGDGFTEPIRSVVAAEQGSRLEIIYRDRSFHFRSENDGTARHIYEELTRLRAGEQRHSGGSL